MYFRKVFNIEKTVKKATLDYTALGIVKAYCNSQSFGEDMLTPGWTDYNVRIPYYINKLYSNIVASQKSNFINVPTDCPQRDERLGWTGDAQAFCLSAMYNADCRVFFLKYLQDIRDAQCENGMIDYIAPSIWIDHDKVKGSPAWGDAITVIPYEYYRVYRDESIIRETLSAAKKWVKYCLSDSIDWCDGKQSESIT